jgi:hypothetical protein
VAARLAVAWDGYPAVLKVPTRSLARQSADRLSTPSEAKPLIDYKKSDLWGLVKPGSSLRRSLQQGRTRVVPCDCLQLYTLLYKLLRVWLNRLVTSAKD